MANKIEMKSLRAMAVDDVTREIAAEGVELSYGQADSLGSVVLDWMQSRLGLTVTETDGCVECSPN